MATWRLVTEIECAHCREPFDPADLPEVDEAITHVGDAAAWECPGCGRRNVTEGFMAYNTRKESI